MPNPSEYSKSKRVPFNIVPETDAIINAEPKNAPTQGVKFIEKIIPKRNAEKIPFIFEAFLLLFLNSFIWIRSK